MTGRQIPAPIRRQVAERYGLIPGQTLEIPCHYGCGAVTQAHWPLNRNGSASYWPMFGRDFALDHVVPFSVVRSHEAANLVVACGRCNSSKRDRVAPRSGNGSGAIPGKVPARLCQEGNGREEEGKRNGRDLRWSPLSVVVRETPSSSSPYVTRGVANG